MRTTVTLEDDVATDLDRLQKTRGEPFKQTLNAVLRAGLASMKANRAPQPIRYKTKPVSLGKPRLKNVDDISEVLAFAEGEDHPVIVVDANLLLYATISDFEQHVAARAWLDERFNALIRVGLPWQSLLAFLRISTNQRVFPRPMAMAAAWGRVTQWLDLPNVWIPEPTERHRKLLDSFLTGNAGASKLVSDAHLAAIALGHGLTLCSTDGDFARFKELRWENPLSP